MTTHTLKKSTTPSIFIPAPDLLDLVKKNLTGQDAITMLWSILGSMEFRIAGLAGIMTNSLNADLRKLNDGVINYTEAMVYMDSMEELTQLFQGARDDRKQMKEDLQELLAYRTTVADYLATFQTRIRVVDWMNTLQMVSKPQLPEQWKLDMEWERAQQEGTKLTRTECDRLTTSDMRGKAAAWVNHCNVVMNIIQMADTGESIEFMKLNKRLQMSLLGKFAKLLDDKEALEIVRKRVATNARSRAGFDSTWMLFLAFYKDCALALTHHRYDSIRDTLVPNAASVVQQKAQADKIKMNAPTGLISDIVEKKMKAAQRKKAKATDARGAALKRHVAPKKRTTKVKDLADIKALDIKIQPEPLKAPVITTPAVDAIRSLLEMPDDVI